MKMKKIAMTVALAALLTGGTAQAGPNPFSDCGIGAALFPTNDALATISNVIWDIGTTAVTSATASPETCSSKEAEAAAFIFESYDELVVDSSHGVGEHFSTLMNILEVKPANRVLVMSELREDMSRYIPTSTAAEKLESSEFFYNSVLDAMKKPS
ncbi:DUF3015 domain-containing protein [bacterium]|nr:DUF3015 domain-containing protein [Pseudomonadales bacterium]MDB4408381.1 DUF3015 domain-containing protein [bacterium]